MFYIVNIIVSFVMYYFDVPIQCLCHVEFSRRLKPEIWEDFIRSLESWRYRG